MRGLAGDKQIVLLCFINFVSIPSTDSLSSFILALSSRSPAAREGADSGTWQLNPQTSRWHLTFHKGVVTVEERGQGHRLYPVAVCFLRDSRSERAVVRMAVNFNDRNCGFFQREVVDFINKQILRNGVSPHFYSMQLCKSWSDMEKKLRDVLTNSAVAEATKEACAWKTLAQAVRVAQRQKRELVEKVKKLQDQLEEQKLFTNVLVGTVNRLRDMQEREKKAAQLQLQESLTALRGVEEERNLLRNELLRVSSAQSQKQDRAVENKKGKEVWMFGKFAFAQAVASDIGARGGGGGGGGGREGSRPGVCYSSWDCSSSGGGSGGEGMAVWGSDRGGEGVGGYQLFLALRS